MSKTRTPKSNHKHTYESCLLYDNDMDNCFRAEYCTICGKIGEINFLETVPSETSRHSKLLTSEEVKEKYKHLKAFVIESFITQKYVKLEIEM